MDEIRNQDQGAGTPETPQPAQPQESQEPTTAPQQPAEPTTNVPAQEPDKEAPASNEPVSGGQ